MDTQIQTQRHIHTERHRYSHTNIDTDTHPIGFAALSVHGRKVLFHNTFDGCSSLQAPVVRKLLKQIGDLS